MFMTVNSKGNMVMRIESDKTYHVERFTEEHDSDYGNLPGDDVKRILKGYVYDFDMEMWFSPKGLVGYSVTEVA